MSLRLYIKQQLGKSDYYLRFRYHKKVLIAWKWFNPEAALVLKKQELFYKTLLQLRKVNSRLIFDIGANEGFLTALFIHTADRVIAVEPSPMNARILRNRFRRQKTVEIIEKAISDHVGTAFLFMEKRGTAFHTLNNQWKVLLESGSHNFKADFNAPITVSTLTLHSLIEQFGCPLLLKIDTEGLERQVLSSLTQAVPLIVFEAILPEFLEDTVAAIRHLRNIDPQAVFNYAIDYTIAYDQSMSADAFESTLRLVKQPVDILVRMHNYKYYYQ